MKYLVIYRSERGVVIEHHNDNRHFVSSRVIHFSTLPLALASVFNRILFYVPAHLRLIWEPEFRTEWETPHV